MNNFLYLLIQEGGSYKSAQAEWQRNTTKEMIRFAESFTSRRIICAPAESNITPQILNNFIKSNEICQGDAIILTKDITRNPYFVHGLYFRLQEAGAKLYDMQPKQFRPYIMPELIQYKSDLAQHDKTLIFISEIIPPKLWGDQELRYVNECQWDQKAWIHTSDHLGHFVSQDSEPETLIQDASQLGKRLGHNTTIDFKTSAFALDPEADPIFNEALAIEIMNRGGVVVDIRYEKEIDKVEIKMFETEFDEDETERKMFWDQER